MQENFELVQKGFRILVSSMSGYIGQELNKIYKNVWWNEVLSTLYDQRDLPSSGTYGELLDSLDIANCIRLLDRKWNDVFRNLLPQDCRTWSKELMGVRNIVAHIGQQDLEQPVAERSLDTMALLCKEIDSEGAEEIREIYRDVRARAAGVPSTAGYVGLSQPASDSKRGELTEGSLLQLVGTEAVQKTTLTRKVTYGGKTVIYPVYRVRLDYLYYNDQNDRIATWITRYEAENGEDALHRAKIHTVGDMLEYSEETLGEIRNLGKKSIGEIIEKIKEYKRIDEEGRLPDKTENNVDFSIPEDFEEWIMDLENQKLVGDWLREKEIRIEILELLPVKAFNLLMFAGYDFIYQIAFMSQNKLMEIPRMDVVSASEIEKNTAHYIREIS